MSIRLLTEEEIFILEQQGCVADDWTAVTVSEDFSAACVRNVEMHGEVRLGTFSGSIEVSRGCWRRCGVRNAVLCDVTVGDNCLIDNVGCHISNYDIGVDCVIMNVGTVETTDGATFGQGQVISVLNEAGQGNVTLYPCMSAQMADLMVRCSHDKEAFARLRHAVADAVDNGVPSRGTVGDRAKIVNTVEVVNTIIGDDCEVSGALRLGNCTVTGEPDAPSYVGSGVICENSIVCGGSSVTDGARLDNCYAGEACTLTGGFTAENSVFFANSYMANGEACAAFCGPFSVSHHKSSLLIGCQYSFYNAGSATNFSNHAYKLGPIHYGLLSRGTKTASGSHLLLPASIGAFSVVLGRITSHPDTRLMPFSYIIGGADGGTWLVPGRNIATVGLYRDTRKWPRRDVRQLPCRYSVINFSWLNPVTVGAALSAIGEIETLLAGADDGAEVLTWHGLSVRKSSLRHGLDYYNMAVSMYLADVLRRNAGRLSDIDLSGISSEREPWTDLSGLILPESEVQTLVESLASGDIATVEAVEDSLKDLSSQSDAYELNWALSLIKSLYGSFRPSDIIAEGEAARQKWLAAIAADADKEAQMGDVEPDLAARFHEEIMAEQRRIDSEG